MCGLHMDIHWLFMDCKFWSRIPISESVCTLAIFPRNVGMTHDHPLAWETKPWSWRIWQDVDGCYLPTESVLRRRPSLSRSGYKFLSPARFDTTVPIAKIKKQHDNPCHRYRLCSFPSLANHWSWGARIWIQSSSPFLLWPVLAESKWLQTCANLSSAGGPTVSLDWSEFDIWME